MNMIMRINLTTAGGLQYNVHFCSPCDNDRRIICGFRPGEYPKHTTEGSHCGFADCHPNDAFNEEAGRKISLGRAMKTYGLPPEVRKVVWYAYLGYSGKREMAHTGLLGQAQCSLREIRDMADPHASANEDRIQQIVEAALNLLDTEKNG